MGGGGELGVVESKNRHSPSGGRKEDVSTTTKVYIVVEGCNNAQKSQCVIQMHSTLLWYRAMVPYSCT